MLNRWWVVSSAMALVLTSVGCEGGDDSSSDPSGDDMNAGDDSNASADEADAGGDEAPADDGGDGQPGDDEGGETGEDPQDDGADAADDAGPADTGGEAESGDPPGEGESGASNACYEQAADACEMCACDNCLTQLEACEADTGCVAIRTCAQETGCVGIDCLGPCGSVIDQNGGPLGPSAGLATMLSDCYTNAGCNDAC